MRDTGCESNARDARTTVTPIELGSRTRWAELNGAKVFTDVDLPEPVLDALVTLVDAVQTAFADVDTREREIDANRARPLCRWHVGQYADYCGPCRSERIAAR